MLVAYPKSIYAESAQPRNRAKVPRPSFACVLSLYGLGPRLALPLHFSVGSKIIRAKEGEPRGGSTVSKGHC